MEIEKWLQLYEQYNGCNCYEIYFLFNQKLYKIELKRLDAGFVKMGRESSSKGGWEKLRLAVNKAKKIEWLASGKAREVMTQDKFVKLAEELGLNKGQACEYLSAKARKQSYTLDSTRFDKAGDVNLKRKKIQVKFQNASIAPLELIDRLLAK